MGRSHEFVCLCDASRYGISDFDLEKLRKNCLRVREFLVYAPQEETETPECVNLGGLSPEQALARACGLAAEKGTHLIFLGAPLDFEDSHLLEMVRIFDEDPFFGMVCPRYCQEGGDLVYGMKLGAPMLARKALARLPEYWITPEFIAPFLLLRRQIVANPPDTPHYDSLFGAIAHFLCKARRLSFRQAVLNRVALPTNLPASDLFPILPNEDSLRFQGTCIRNFSYPLPKGEDQKHFLQKYPPVDLSGAWLDSHPMHRLERLCAAAWPPAGEKKRICIDCRGMLAFFCGTTVSQLGFLKGLEHYTDEWTIDILAKDFAHRAHNLAASFPKLNFIEPPDNNCPFPTEEYAAIIHMNQPCNLSVLRDLHEHGLVIGCNMLDTISWDMILGCPPEAEASWNFAARHMDCIFYNSEFSIRRFNCRFPVRNHILQIATWHSFTQAENTSPLVSGCETQDYILIFGNAYDHKAVLATAERLAKIAPAAPLVVFGMESGNIANAKFMRGGDVADEEVDRLIASAKLVIYPSWHEGFGLPVVKALAYGRPVLVRSLPLWQEIASHCHLPGKLMEFEDEKSLSLAVQAVLDGQSYPIVPQGWADELDWKACAGILLSGINPCLQSFNAENWLERDQVMRFYGQET